MKKRYALLYVISATALIAAPASAQDWDLPDSPTGSALAALLDVVASGDSSDAASFVLTRMDERFRTDHPLDAHVSFFQRLHQDLVPFQIESLRKTGDYSAAVVLTATERPVRIRIRFGLSERPPHRFNDLDVQPVTGPDMSFASTRALNEYLSRREEDGTFSGVVLIGRRGEIEFLRAYGLASKRYGAPNRTDTRFNIGSINKLFTGVAILQLAQRGMINLDAEIGTYVNDFPEDVARTVTVRHLLQHSAGWESYFDKEYYLNNWPRLRSVSDYMEFIPEIPLDFPPGMARQYSNVGYVVLGAIVEAVSGQDYYDYVRENIFVPAGMPSTDSYEMDDPINNLATGYVTDTEGESFGRENTFLHSARGTPAGGGYSTAEDLYRFDQALRSYRLLDPANTHLLLRGFEGPAEAGRLVGGVGYAGGGPGISAVIEMDFDTGVTVIVLSNYDPPTAEELGRPIMEMATSADAPSD